MRILNKIKSLFSRKPVEVQEQATQEVAIIADAQSSIKCVFCSKPITTDDRVKQIGEYPLHKRCFKKVQRLLLEGKSMEAIIANQVQEMRKEVD